MTASPLLLLLDPLALGLPGLRYRFLGEEEAPAGGGGPPRRFARLELRALDGYRAEALLELHPAAADKSSPGAVLPARFECPLLFPEERERRAMGTVPAVKTISFLEYRPSGGRRVPARIRFEDGLNPFELVLKELEINPPGRERAFEK